MFGSKIEKELGFWGILMGALVLLAFFVSGPAACTWDDSASEWAGARCYKYEMNEKTKKEEKIFIRCNESNNKKSSSKWGRCPTGFVFDEKTKECILSGSQFCESEKDCKKHAYCKAKGCECSNKVCLPVCHDGKACVGKEVCFEGKGCIDIRSDSRKCGKDAQSAKPCRGGEVCYEGACSLTCGNDKENCNGGCFDLQKDNKHCGGCGIECKKGDVCSGGVCGLDCQKGLLNCGGQCIDPLRDNIHCGGCSGEAAEGGKVGKSCSPGEVCNEGECGLSCQEGLTNCEGKCVDITSDIVHCGGCRGEGVEEGKFGKSCNPGEVCISGECKLSCQTGLDKCNGKCVDFKTDNAHCGGCGKGCDKGYVCNNSKCDLSCQQGLEKCDGKCVDLEAYHLRKVRQGHEGCLKCEDANGVEECAECVGGWSDCKNGKLKDGCEVNTAVDVRNCGGCGKVCASGEVCSDGSCSLTCQEGTVNCGGKCVKLEAYHLSECQKCVKGWENCDGKWENGCEVNTDVDAGNCGGCGNKDVKFKCKDGQVCSKGKCLVSCLEGHKPCNGECLHRDSFVTYHIANCDGGVLKCEHGWGNCDGQVWNGCEKEGGC